MPRLIPVLLSRSEVRMLLDQGEVTMRRPLSRWAGGESVPSRYGRPGNQLWAREAFATRQDGDQIKIRYPADGDRGRPRFVPIQQAERKYQTARYVTRPAKYMPRWASRITLEVVASEIERVGRGHVAVVRAKLLDVTESREVTARRPAGA